MNPISHFLCHKLKPVHHVFAVVLLCFLLISYSSYGQKNSIATDNPKRSDLDKQVDQYVMQYLQDKRAVGLSIGIIKNGKSYFYNYGETKAGNGQRPDKRTLYEIGSTTKSFTGILLGQAIIDHKLRLDDDIRDHLKGDFPNLVYQGTPITIRHLASHTSRITRIFPNMWERPEYDSLNPLKNYNKTLLYQGLRQMKMDTLPGKKYAYSNMAVALLGTILEDAYGQDYFSLVGKYILGPLKMGNTMIHTEALPASRIAWPHDENRKPVPMWDMFSVPAMGALRSTTDDMVKYIIANDNETDPAIKLSHQRIFGTEQEGMGLNWFIHRTPDGYRVLEHSGGTGGSRSSLECFPELKCGFVILTNSLANRNQLEKDLAKLIASKTNL